MEPLIITVTVDSSTAYPGNHFMPPLTDVDSVARQYIDAVNAGATICHHHGVHYLDDEVQDDGKRLKRVDFDGWKYLTETIRGGTDGAIIQFGLASVRLAEKIKLMESLGPEMASYAFNPHDEYFRPDPAFPAAEVYALHPRDELEEFSRACLDLGVKPEVECFYTGAYWNLEFIRRKGLLQNPVWATLFFGWQGGTWTPPTQDAVLYMVRHLPPDVTWNASVMDAATQWKLVSLVIALGGHVRVGWEDNPFLPNGELAATNAELVQIVTTMAGCIGRPIATPEEARAIIGLES